MPLMQVSAVSLPVATSFIHIANTVKKDAFAENKLTKRPPIYMLTHGLT